VRRGLAAAVVVWLAALPAWAAEEGGATFLGLPTIFWKVANFAFFFGLLYFLLARPASRFFQSRREQVATQLAEAERAQREAEQLRAEMAQRVAALSSEIKALQERLHGDGEREREALERQGDAEAARLTAQIEQEAGRRVADARRELAAEAASVAADLALELLQRELTAEDRERIFRTTLERLEERPAGGAR
jgi:F-type H+-transporting ATPase subunit b